MEMSKKAQTKLYCALVAVLSAALLYAALLAWMPQVRDAIVRAAEMFLMRQQLNRKLWDQRLFKWSAAGAFLFAASIAPLTLGYLKSKADCDTKDTHERVFVRVLYGFAVINILIICMSWVNQSVFMDEASTLAKLRMPYKGILSYLGQRDVHCPLYFFITKFFVDAVHLVFHKANTVILAKIVSLIPIVLMVLAAPTKVKRNWGSLCGAYFAMCATGMPMMMFFAAELRMYSWLMLFITLTFLYAYDCAASAPPPRKAQLDIASTI